MKADSKQCRKDQPQWNPNANKLHKVAVPQVSDGVGKRKAVTDNDKR